MREADLHVPYEAIEELGFDVAADGFRETDVRDVTLVSGDGRESIAVITYSDPVDDALADADHVAWWERLRTDGGAATYLCKAVAPDPSGDPPTVEELDLVVQSVTPADGGFTLSVVGSHDALQCHAESEGDADLPVSLRRVTDYEGPSDELDALTGRQREVLETAYELGYYEVPRETAAEEVARRLDLDRSTVTEHLQRAERHLVAAALSG